MHGSKTRGLRLFLGVAAGLLLTAQQSLAHLTRNECIQGSGCVAGAAGGQASFEFSANTTANPPLHSGSFTFTDASAGISVSSDTLLEYADAGNESERLLSFRLEGDLYSEARLFVTDAGPSESDSFRIQLLDLSGVPVIERGGALLVACGGGITTAPSCVPPVPCELQLTVACVVGTSNPSSDSCTIAGASAQVKFIYTLKNTGTSAILLSSLTGSDAFGDIDFGQSGSESLQPGEEVSFEADELVSGPFPFVNTVTITSTRNGITCSDMATVTIRKQPSGPGSEPGEECPDFVTGGGWIVGTPSGGKANFGVHGGIKNGQLWGGLNYLDHKRKLHVKSTAVTDYTKVSAVGRQIKFNVKINGEAGTAIVIVHDNGEPGRDDRFEIQLSSGYSAGGDLGGNRPGGGNIQLHTNKDCEEPGGGETGGGTGGGPGGGETGGGTGGGPGGGENGGGTGGGPGTGTDECPRTIGYWKNHDSHLSQVLGKGAINLGSQTVRTVSEALAVLGAASSTDARLMLKAQLLATLLNLQNGSDAMQTGADVRVTTQAAVQFLASHSSAVGSEHPDRQQALSLKDKLDAYNNSQSNCNDSGGGGSSGGGTGQPGDDDDDNGSGGSGGGSGHADCKHSNPCKTKIFCDLKTKVESHLKNKSSSRK